MFFKKKKTLAAMVCATAIASFAAAFPAAAQDVPGNAYPSVSYGSTAWSSYVPIPTVTVKDKWNQIGWDKRYDSWDKDTFQALNAKANVSLSTTNSSTYKISGSTEFNFPLVSKATISGEWGQSWGKTTTVTYDAQPGYTYELWSANQIKRLYWTYPQSSTGKSYNSQSEGSDGTYKWFFRHQ